MMTEKTTKTDTKLSMVMVVHDQEEALEQNLPIFLSQTSKTPYEVIVVDDMSSDRTPDILKEMKEKYPHLHTTFFPPSVLNPSRLQLALSIGVKAAHSDWIVFSDINRPPTTEDWIDALAEELATNYPPEAMLVYSNRKHPEIISYQAFAQLEDAFPILHKAERKSDKGHKGKWMKAKRGLYDAAVVHRSRIYDAIRQYDLNIKGGRLLGLRMMVALKNLTN